MYITYSVMRQISFLLFLALLLGNAICDGHCPLKSTELSELHTGRDVIDHRWCSCDEKFHERNGSESFLLIFILKTS